VACGPLSQMNWLIDWLIINQCYQISSDYVFFTFIINRTFLKQLSAWCRHDVNMTSTWRCCCHWHAQWRASCDVDYLATGVDSAAITSTRRPAQGWREWMSEVLVHAISVSSSSSSSLSLSIIANVSIRQWQSSTVTISLSPSLSVVCSTPLRFAAFSSH